MTLPFTKRSSSFSDGVQCIKSSLLPRVISDACVVIYPCGRARLCGANRRGAKWQAQASETNIKSVRKGPVLKITDLGEVI